MFYGLLISHLPVFPLFLLVVPRFVWCILVCVSVSAEQVLLGSINQSITTTF
jgi:hypothetical protein